MTSHLLLAVSTGIHQFHSLFEGIKTTDIQRHLRKCRWINITECNSHATSSDPAMKELMVNPAFVAYCISATTDLIGIHKSFNHFLCSNKDYHITSTSNYSNFEFVPRGVILHFSLAFSSYHLWSMRIHWHTYLIYIVNPFWMAFKIKLITYFSEKPIVPFNVLSNNNIHTHTCCGITLS